MLIVFSFPATCNLKFQSALDCGRLSQPSCGSRFYQQSVPTKGIETGQAMIVKSLQLKACWENNFFDNKYNFPAFDGDFVCVRLSSVIPKTTLLFLKSPSYQARLWDNENSWEIQNLHTERCFRTFSFPIAGRQLDIGRRTLTAIKKRLNHTKILHCFDHVWAPTIFVDFGYLGSRAVASMVRCGFVAPVWKSCNKPWAKDTKDNYSYR